MPPQAYHRMLGICLGPEPPETADEADRRAGKVGWFRWSRRPSEWMRWSGRSVGGLVLRVFAQVAGTRNGGVCATTSPETNISKPIASGHIRASGGASFCTAVTSKAW